MLSCATAEDLETSAPHKYDAIFGDQRLGLLLQCGRATPESPEPEKLRLGDESSGQRTCFAELIYILESAHTLNGLLLSCMVQKQVSCSMGEIGLHNH